MAGSKPHVRQYRVTAGEEAGATLTINRQMKGVRIDTHPSKPDMSGKVFDMFKFMEVFDLDFLELILPE